MMPRLGFTAAFAKYGAKLPNRMWAVSAIGADGSLVISYRRRRFSDPKKGVLR